MNKAWNIKVLVKVRYGCGHSEEKEFNFETAVKSEENEEE